jgi:hypothetical protein
MPRFNKKEVGIGTLMRGNPGAGLAVAEIYAIEQRNNRAQWLHYISVTSRETGIRQNRFSDYR